MTIPAAPGSFSGAPNTIRPRIVLVEDDAGVRRSLQLVLQARGLDVRSYATAAAVLGDPAALDAACLVTDYALGETTGTTLAQTLRARGWHGPAILITAFPSPALTAEASAAGIARVLEKPFQEHALIDAVLSSLRTPAS
ncbi:MAG: response regulator [Sphingobium sp.]|jgi:FixJ family two-component response regulator|nr:MAG: response regulator [Sphingobium sp.]